MAEFTYPSIAGPTFDLLGRPCVAFEKFDGSNLRFFWSQKRGWHSTGTRFKWFKPATPTFGVAAALFQEQFADEIVSVLRRMKEYRGVTEVIAFCEFFGASTFSGLHVEEEARELHLFDIYVPGRDFVPAKDFVAHFGHLKTAPVVYEGPFDRDFIDAVRAGSYPVTEGVVVKGTRVKRRRKGKDEHEVWMAKVKTLSWLEELHRRSASSEDFQREYERNLTEQELPANPAIESEKKI